MANGRNLSQNEVAGFLLGLGIGLIVGLLFQPADDARRFLQDGLVRSPAEASSDPPSPTRA
jgi:hypothetical protein